jgi:peptidoglycan/LPS O-acetylase OafA/YrhL
MLDRANRFEALEAVRALASIGVVVTHVSFQTATTKDGWWAGPLARLDFGVALFFVLSGFLLFLPYARRRFAGAAPPPAGPYFWRRALRILPAYWLTVTVCFMVLPENAKVTTADWVRHLLLLQNYQPATLRAGLTQTWSLVTEVAFYLLLPLLAPLVLGRRGRPLASRRPLLVLAALVGVNVAYLLIGHALDPEAKQPLGGWLPGLIAWFAVGMGLAQVRAWFEQPGSASARLAWLRDLPKAPGSCWLLALFLFVIATTPVAGPLLLFPATGWETVAKTLLYAGAAGLIVLPLVLGDQDDNGLVRALSARPLWWLGELSYSIFLWHLVVMAFVFELLDIPLFQGRFFLVLGLTLAGTLVVSTLSYVLLERPILRLKRRYPFQSGRSGQDGSTVETTQPSASTQSAAAPRS